MRAEQQIRTWMEPADPARSVPVPSAVVPATQLIARAEAGEPAPARRRPLLARRRLLAGAAAALAAVVTYPLVQSEPDRPAEQLVGSVVVPIAYEISDNPPPAGDFLRELADQIGDAPYDGRTGPYAYHRTRTWHAMNITLGQEPELEAIAASEVETWAAADGSGRERGRSLGLEFPDEDSRRSLSADPKLLEVLEALSSAGEHVSAAPPGTLHPGTPLPTDREGLIDTLDHFSEDDAFYAIEQLYEGYVVPREIRAMALEILADEPNVRWRGEVTDRAGRTGVAVTSEDGAQDDGISTQDLLVFDPRTGELLAREVLILQDLLGATWPEVPSVSYYSLLLETTWTDERGPEPNAQPLSPPTSSPESTPERDADPSPTPGP